MALGAEGVFQITLKVFVERGHEFLVLNDTKSQVGDLPGGRLNPGEIYRPFAESIHRELHEELGPDLRVELMDTEQPCFVFPHFISESGYEALGMAFRARYISGEITLSDEHDRFLWVDQHDFSPGGWFEETMVDAIQRYQVMMRG